MDKNRKHKRSKTSTRRTRSNVVLISSQELPRTGVSRVPVVLDFFKFSRQTLWRMVQAKRFPAPIRISAGLIGWDNAKLWQYVEAGGQWTEHQEVREAA